MNVSITPSGGTTAGANFNLSCSVSGATVTPKIGWVRPNNAVHNNSLLQFTPLRASHGGNYTCNVVMTGSMTEMLISTVTVNRMSIIIL